MNNKNTHTIGIPNLDHSIINFKKPEILPILLIISIPIVHGILHAIVV
jgi:hypothetical protein